MQRIRRCCTAVLSRMIFIGFSIQILMGILWMYNAFAGLRGFGEGIVCVGQILLAFCASWFFFCSIGARKSWVRLFGSLAAVTFPMIMQCHMAIGPQSAVSSVFLILTGLAVRAGRKKMIYQLLAGLVMAGLVLGTDVGYQGRRDISVCMASRFAWTTMANIYVCWPQEYRDKVDHDLVVHSSYEAGGIQHILAPSLTETLGEEETHRLLMGISGASWRLNRNRILKEISWDIAGYTVSPLIAPMQLRGKGYDSYTGVNYRDILNASPRIGRRYMDYGCWWFAAGLAITVFLAILLKKRIRLRETAVILFVGALMAVVYTMSGAGCMDYRNTIYILYVWLAAMVKTAGEGLESQSG